MVSKPVIQHHSQTQLAALCWWLMSGSAAFRVGPLNEALQSAGLDYSKWRKPRIRSVLPDDSPCSDSRPLQESLAAAPFDASIAYVVWEKCSMSTAQHQYYRSVCRYYTLRCPCQKVVDSKCCITMRNSILWLRHVERSRRSLCSNTGGKRVCQMYKTKSQWPREGIFSEKKHSITTVR